MRKLLSVLMLLLLAQFVFIRCKDDEEIAPLVDVENLEAEAGLEYVVLTWEIPAGTTIQEYLLSYTPGGVPVTIEGDQTTYTISKLASSTEYIFTLKSKNTKGVLSEGVTVNTTTLEDDMTPDDHFVGNLEVVLQEGLAAFDPKYTYIQGDVVITGPDITDLSVLQNVDTISGKLEIYFNDNLQSLAGLSKLRYVGDNVYIRANVKLANLDAFSNLVYIGKDLSVLGLPLIANLNGFQNVTTINGSVYIGTEAWKNPPVARPNTLLTDFCGLRTLLNGNGLKGELHVANNGANPTRQDIIGGSCSGGGLEEVTNLAVVSGNKQVILSWKAPASATVTGYELTYTPNGSTPVALGKAVETYTVTGLANGTNYTFTIKSKGSGSATSQGVTINATPQLGRQVYVGNLSITSQAQLNSLSEYTTITGALTISGADITDLSRLANLDSVKNKLEIIGCTSLASVEAFSKLKYVGHNFYLQNNPSVTSLEGFRNLIKIARDIVILQMTGITNLNGLRSVETGRNLYVGVEGWLASPPADKGNTQLNNLCGLKKLLQSSPGLTGAYFVANNASNPLRTEIASQCQ